MTIRPYDEASDFEEIKHWASISPEQALTREQLSPTTFIAVSESGEKIAAICILLTNSKHYCIPEGLFTNPELPVRVRKEAITMLCGYVEAFAKALEYKGLFCLPINRSMERHFENLGFSPMGERVSTMYKAIGG